MIKVKDAIKTARSLIGTPYAQLDCINLIKKVIRTSEGGVADYTTAGSNTLWESYEAAPKYRDLTWRQTGLKGAEAGMLAFKASYNNYHHVGIVTGSGTVIHSSSTQGGRGVVETPFSSAEGWTHLAKHRHIDTDKEAEEEPMSYLCSAVVTLSDKDSWLNVRNAPSGDVIGKLYDGAPIKIMAEMDEWAFVRYVEGKSGYVNVKFIEPVKAEEEPVKEEQGDEGVHVQLVMTDSAGNTWIPVGDFRAELRAVVD